jgi:hypothetical protein
MNDGKALPNPETISHGCLKRSVSARVTPMGACQMGSLDFSDGLNTLPQ